MKSKKMEKRKTRKQNQEKKKKLRKLFLISLLGILLLDIAFIQNVGAEEEKTFIYGETSRILSLDPISVKDEISDRIASLIFNSLISFDENLNIVNDLAKKFDVEFGIGELIITFYLREGVKWHNDEEFTADDVVYTYRAIRDERNLSPILVKLKDVVLSCEKKSKYVVSFRLKGKSISNIGLLDFKIIPQLSEESTLIPVKFKKEPVGTGPFKLRNVFPDGSILLAKNEKYFKGAPKIHNILQKVFEDRFVMLSEFEVGGIHLIPVVPLDILDRIRGDPKNVVESFPSLSFSFIGFNLRNKYLSNLKVRQAIAMGFDVRRAKKIVIKDEGTIISGPFPPISWAYNPFVSPWSFSPEISIQLLNEAGFVDKDGDGYVETPDGETFEISIKYARDSVEHEKVALIFREYMKAIGIKVKLKPMEWGALVRDVIDEHNFDLVVLRWTFGIDPDIYPLFHSSQTEKGKLNFVGYANPTVDNILEMARSTDDYSERKKMYYRAHEIIRNELPYLFLWSYNINIAYKKNKFKEINLNPINVFYSVHKWEMN